MPRPMSRREFLTRSAAVAVALPTAGVLLASCGDGEAEITSGNSARTLARPDNPVEWPLTSEPIPSDLPIEEGVLDIYSWEYYIKPGLMDRFEEETGVRVRYHSFEDQFEMVAKLRTGSVSYDMVVGATIDVLGGLIDSGLVQPLNHDYLKELDRLWEVFQSPFYDVGSRYSVPYNVWTSGMSWRNDLIPDSQILDRYSPYDAFWDPRYSGRTHLLNGFRESTAMALLRNGISDVNTEDPADLDVALQDLLDLVDLMHPAFDHNDYEDMFGDVALHQSWSGNVVNMHLYAPAPSDLKNISFLWPPQQGTGLPGVVGSDTMVILRNSKVPVAAHAFMDFLLDPPVSFENALYTGYQPPEYSIEPKDFIEHGVLLPSQSAVLVNESEFAEGHQLLELSPAGSQLWDATYEQVLTASGAGSVAGS